MTAIVALCQALCVGDEARGIRSENNLFDRPIEERRRDFEKRLAEMVIARTKRDSVSFS